MNGESTSTRTATTPRSSPQRITPTSASFNSRETSSSFASTSSTRTPAPNTPLNASTSNTTDATTSNNAEVLPSPRTPSLSRRDSSCVQVAVRIRPILSWEKKEVVCQVVQGDSIQIGGNSGPRFTFDNVFPPDTTQAQLFEHAVRPLIQKCLEGYNATIFAYGQTGSGKTHTILGPADSWMTYDAQEPENSTAGVLPRALQALFAALDAQAAADPAAFSYTVTLQFLEIYGEDIRDLIAPRTALGSKLTVREYNDGETGVPGAVAEPCTSALDATRAVEQGSLRRVTAATAMNATSSRSHALLTVTVEQKWESEDMATTAAVTKRSKFQFCDLAGSERQKRTQATGQRLKEGININQGLLVLGNVISALASNSSHVPYRDSKLTRLLSSSLGGNSQTLMMACVSPAPENMEESLNCLRYANRAKNIQNSAIVNLDANSRRVLQLQQQIASLAHTLLQVKIAVDKEEEKSAVVAQIPFSQTDLESLVASGGAWGLEKSALVPMGAATPAAARTPLPPTPLPGIAPATPWTQPQRGTPGTAVREDYRLKEMESRVSTMEKELLQTQRLLKESQAYHDAAEMELARYRAMERLGASRDQAEQEDKENSTADSFLEKATEYEQEILFLKKELQKAERKANRIAMWQNVDAQDEEMRLKDAESSLKQDQVRLNQLRSSGLRAESSESSAKLNMSSDDVLEEEEKAEEQDLQKWTKKYLVQGGHIEEDDEQLNTIDEQNDDTEHTDTPVEFKQLHLENSLVELTKSIEERESLIQELKSSQEKYSAMRDFYEGKLAQMEAELKEKESEREKLVEQLQTAKTRGSTKELQQRLREKDGHIASLREKQKELRKLTSISHRNELDIARLQRDVVDMKRRRVDVEKQLASERKRHASEVKLLKKTATQKEREINKLQKISIQREVQAQKAGQVAKARLEELNSLRAKNREAERRLRMKSVKKGMMEKAGIDSVLVGQRVGTNTKTSSKRSQKKSAIDADALRSLFDTKISDVVRKEALADKLAEEWEEHYDLTTRKQELMVSTEPDADDALQALAVKIKYKQRRIRQLAQKLGKQDPGGDKKDDGNRKDYELFDDQYEKICKDSNPEQAQKTLAKVLFGMVVRERRRISALARTASSLDEKLQLKEKEAEESESHLRASIHEQRQLAAELSSSQQKSILSLMEMVKVDKATVGKNDDDNVSSSEDRKLLALANERIAALEKQIEYLESEASQDQDPNDELLHLRIAYNQEFSRRLEADSELQRTYDTLQEIREYLSNTESSDPGHGSMQSALGLLHGLLSRAKKADTAQPAVCMKAPMESPGSLKRIEIDDADPLAGDDDDFMEDSEWDLELMEDLAFIAEGKIPPSLQNLPGFAEQMAEMESAPMDTGGASVFDRLTNPENFTGTQKLKAKKSRKHVTQRSKPERGSASSVSEHAVRATTQDVAAIPEPITTPSNAQSDDPSLETVTSRKKYKSVFDRLVSPSQATGTQRQRFKTKNQGDDVEDFTDEPSQEDEIDQLLDDALGESKEELFSVEKKEAHPIPEGESSSSLMESPSPNDKKAAGRNNEYAEQDVFERLQRTSTVSYQNRHGDPIRHAVSLDSAVSADQSSDVSGVQQTNSLDDAQRAHEEQQRQYSQLNVFERLQKTTTEAYAKKVQRPKTSDDAS